MKLKQINNLRQITDDINVLKLMIDLDEDKIDMVIYTLDSLNDEDKNNFEIIQSIVMYYKKILEPYYKDDSLLFVENIRSVIKRQYELENGAKIQDILKLHELLNYNGVVLKIFHSKNGALTDIKNIHSFIIKVNNLADKPSAEAARDVIYNKDFNIFQFRTIDELNEIINISDEEKRDKYLNDYFEPTIIRNRNHTDECALIELYNNFKDNLSEEQKEDELLIHSTFFNPIVLQYLKNDEIANLISLALKSDSTTFALEIIRNSSVLKNRTYLEIVKMIEYLNKNGYTAINISLASNEFLNNYYSCKTQLNIISLLNQNENINEQVFNKIKALISSLPAEDIIISKIQRLIKDELTVSEIINSSDSISEVYFNLMNNDINKIDSYNNESVIKNKKDLILCQNYGKKEK